VFPLPEISPPPRGSQPIDFVGGWHEPQVGRGVITDVIPVMPGTMEVAYALKFEPRASTATLRWVLPYGATDVELLVDPGIRISATGVSAAGDLTARGRRYARWSGGPVSPGEAISVRMSGLRVFEDRWPEIVAALLAIALTCGLAVALRRRPAAADRQSR